MTKPENPQAFPHERQSIGDGSFRLAQGGMTLLDYFAGQALSDVLHHFSWDEKEIGKAVTLSYKLSKAMLKERSKHMESWQKEDTP